MVRENYEMLKEKQKEKNGQTYKWRKRLRKWYLLISLQSGNIFEWLCKVKRSIKAANDKERQKEREK